MKLLVAYDGSAAGEEMLEELGSAGYRTGEALVLCVQERRLNAELVASEGARILEQRLPGWKLGAEVARGPVAETIVERAAEWGAEGIAVSSLGRHGLAKILLGSVAQKVANEARCSVRVCRGTRKPKFVVGYDGTAAALEAVREIAGRHWSEGAWTRILTCVGFGSAPVSGLSLAEDYDLARGMQAKAERILASAGLEASGVVREDDPKSGIVDEARLTEAGCIFIGHNDRSLRERLLLGTVAGAVLQRAHCSVEVIRR